MAHALHPNTTTNRNFPYLLVLAPYGLVDPRRAKQLWILPLVVRGRGWTRLRKAAAKAEAADTESRPWFVNHEATNGIARFSPGTPRHAERAATSRPPDVRAPFSFSRGRAPSVRPSMAPRRRWIASRIARSGDKSKERIPVLRSMRFLSCCFAVRIESVSGFHLDGPAQAPTRSCSQPASPR